MDRDDSLETNNEDISIWVCEYCAKGHDEQKMRKCNNCSMEVCTLCLKQCAFCKIKYCPACDNESELLTKKQKQRTALSIPEYGIRIVDDSSIYPENIKRIPITYTYYLCDACNS